MKKPSILTLYVAYRIEQERGDKNREKATFGQIAERWGMSHVSIHHVSQLRRGVGQTMERLIANAECGGSVDELNRIAAAWYRENANWRPSGYVSLDTPGTNATFEWWEEEAARMLTERPSIAWAVRAAAVQVRGAEPRPDRRRAYVERAVDSVLDLPEVEIARLKARRTSRAGRR